eukprot:TRINITY_DN3058_c0_g1_i1.p1 TRINITY_DN3058_c0_g1~~TRINITY_DN3058_c0_g1_i1.p1  ORF type:complete len:656 (+),score=123.95 TRINITY_DN3058_c0_g1_i1:82-2049(+)
MLSPWHLFNSDSPPSSLSSSSTSSSISPLSSPTRGAHHPICAKKSSLSEEDEPESLQIRREEKDRPSMAARATAHLPTSASMTTALVLFESNSPSSTASNAVSASSPSKAPNRVKTTPVSSSAPTEDSSSSSLSPRTSPTESGGELSTSTGEKFLQMSEPFISATKSLIFFAPKVLAKTLQATTSLTSAMIAAELSTGRASNTTSTPTLTSSPPPSLPSPSKMLYIEQAATGTAPAPHEMDVILEEVNPPVGEKTSCIPKALKSPHSHSHSHEEKEKVKSNSSDSPSALVGVLQFLRTIPKVPERIISSAVHSMGRSKSDEADSGPPWFISDSMYQTFVERIHDKRSGNLSKIVNAFIDKFDAKKYAHSTRIIEFLEAILESYEGNFEWILPIDKFWICLEKYIMEKLYSKTFACESSDLEEDIDLFNRISTLQFITTKHLDVTTQVPSDLLTTSRENLFQLNSCTSPLDKLACILRCCKLIFDLLSQVQAQHFEKIEREGISSSSSSPSSNPQASADEFLPLLIYVILKANPPNLESNIQYISRFHTLASTRFSELNYYFISLVGAVTFIRNIDASSLSIDPEEFQRQMKVTEDIYEPLVFKNPELRLSTRIGTNSGGSPLSTSPISIPRSSFRGEEKTPPSSFEKEWVLLQKE